MQHDINNQFVAQKKVPIIEMICDENKPKSLTVPMTWYPDKRSLLISQEAKNPEAPVTHTLSPLLCSMSKVYVIKTRTMALFIYIENFAWFLFNPHKDEMMKLTELKVMV